MLRSLRLGTKFVLAAIGLTVLATVIVGTIGFSLGQRGIETHTDSHLQSVVALESDRIMGWLEFQRTLTNSDLYPRGNTEVVDTLLSQKPGTPAHDEAIARFEQSIRHMGLGAYAVQNLLLLDAQGRIRYAGDPVMLTQTGTTKEMLLKARDGFYVGLTWAPPALPDSPLLVMAEPARGEASGVTVVFVDPAPLQALLKPDAAMGERGRLYLVQPGAGLVTVNSLMRDTPGGALRILEGVDSGANSTFTSSDNLRMVGQSSQVGSLPWKLVAAMPTEDAFADVGEMRLLMALALVAIGGVAAIGAWRLSLSITGPLKEAVSGAHAIGKGDLDYRIPVGSGDEVGELATSLNQMATNLKDTRVSLDQAQRRIAYQEMSERVLDAVPISLVVLDNDGRIATANEQFCDTFLLSDEECEGQRLSDILKLGQLEPEVERGLSGDRVFQGEWTWENPDGQLRQFYVSISALTSDDEHLHPILALEDITERKQAEERLQEASLLASVGELAAGVAHEINNPLTSILGFSELLTDQDLPEQARGDIKKISVDAQRAAKVVRNLLSFARRYEPDTQYVSVTQIVEKALELRAYEFGINNVQVTAELGEDVPYTMADEHQLVQVMVNILINAEQAMAEANSGGRLTISTETLGDRVRISVSDDGPGITPDELAKIFDPFYTTKEVGKGTGLGLSLSYGIVKQHKGDLWAARNPEKGMTFHIELPIIAPDSDGDVDPHETQTDAAAVPTKHILVVDDEPDIRQLLFRILSAEGHDVDLAGNGEEAWAKIRDRRYDHVLVDLKMPGMSGKELYRLIQKSSIEHASRVVFITGDTMSDESHEFLSAAGRPSLSKPFKREQVLAMIQDIAEVSNV